MDTFIKEQCIEKSKGFFDPLKRINVETFSKLSKCVKYKTDKHITLVTNTNLFAKLTTIMQKCRALAGTVGDLKKLIKQRYYIN